MVYLLPMTYGVSLQAIHALCPATQSPNNLSLYLYTTFKIFLLREIVKNPRKTRLFPMS